MMILVLLIAEVACFAYVWFSEYRNITLIHYRSIGNVAIIGIYAIMLLVFTYNLGGAKYGLLKRNNISFSQGMAIFIVLFFLSTLLPRRQRRRSLSVVYHALPRRTTGIL